MSRIGRKPITIPEKVNVELKDNIFSAKGPAGQLELEVHPKVKVEIKDKEILISVDKPEIKIQKSLWGTFNSLISSMVQGVVEPFKKELEINGVGYNWSLSGQKLTINAGYSHPIEFELPKEVNAKVQKNVLTLESVDKQIVGQVAAEIRGYRKPEPYKGKGIKYIDEQIIRKVGKQVTGTGEGA